MSEARNEPRVSTTSAVALRELAWVFAAITGSSVAISRLGATPPFDEYVHVAVASVFLWTALHYAQRDPRGVDHFGLSLGGFFGATHDQPQRGLLDEARVGLPLMLRELLVALLIGVIVFPPFVFAFAFWHQPARDFVFSFGVDPVSYALAQVLVVALPEEALFRGYFQTRVADLWAHHVGVVTLGTCRLPWLAIVVQAALFALVHFAVDLDVTRLSVFFPGLLFGVIRGIRGGIGAAVFFHALCNLLSDVLVRGWL